MRVQHVVPERLPATPAPRGRRRAAILIGTTLLTLAPALVQASTPATGMAPVVDLPVHPLQPMTPPVSAAAKLPLPTAAAPQAGETWTSFSHTTQDLSGISSAQITAVPAFRQSGSRWQAIDPTVSGRADAQQPLSAEGALRPIRFGTSASRLAEVELDGGPVTLTAPGLNVGGAPSLSGSSVVYGGVATDTDLTYAVGLGGLREELVLHSGAAPLTILTHLSDPAGQLGSIQSTPGGGVRFSTVIDGDVALELTPPQLSTASPAGDLAPGHVPWGATLAVTRAGDGYDVTVGVDPRWIEGRSFPVVLGTTLSFVPLHAAPGAVQQGVASFTPSGCGSCWLVDPAVTSLGVGTLNDAAHDEAPVRSFLRFDLGGMPRTAVVRSAHLSMTRSGCLDGTTGCLLGSSTLTLQALQGVLSTGSSDGDLMQMAATTASATETSGPFDGARPTWDVASTVQDWIDGGAANNGLVVQQQPENAPGGVYDAGTAAPGSGSAPPPTLSLTYSLPSTPARPSAPTGVVALPGSTAAHISWVAPAAAPAPLVGYQVAALDATGAAIASANVCGGCHAATLTGLVPGTSYTAAVRALDVAGSGVPTTASLVTGVDPAAGAPAAPSQVTVHPAPGTVSVDWQAPPTTGGYPVTSYTVTLLRSDGSFERRIDNVCPTCHPLPITSLSSDAAYLATVSAVTAFGEGPPASSAVTLRSISTSAIGNPIPPPQNVAASAWNATAMVSWSAPSLTGVAVSGYTVTAYFGNGTSTGLQQSVCGSCSSTTFTGLTNGQPYYFGVADTTATLSSDQVYSPTVVPVGPPAAPALTSVASGNASATASWNASTSTGGAPIVSYVVEADGVQGDVVQQQDSCGTCSASTFSFAATGLTNGEVYSVSVYARNSAGYWSAKSSAILVTPAAPPSAPQNLAVTPGDGSMAVTWSAPASTGGAAITSYVIDADVNGSGSLAQTVTACGSCATTTLTGLVDGTTYYVTAQAQNSAGASPQVTSALVAPAGPPSPPQSVSAAGGNTVATATWSAPSGTGGFPVASYTVTTYSGNAVVAGPTTLCATCTSYTATGLSNGHPYWFAISATNTAALVGAAATSHIVYASTTPSIPQNVRVGAMTGAANLVWSDSVDNGGFTITSYEAWPYRADGTSAGPMQSCNVPCNGDYIHFDGLTNGQPYYFTLAAVNADGPGAIANSPTATPAAVPGAPPSASATPGNAMATITWTPSTDNGGGAITQYLINAYYPNGTAAGNVRVCNVPCSSYSYPYYGLTNGQQYYFTVAASNWVGVGAATATGTVMPSTISTAPRTVSAAFANMAINLSWTIPSNSGGYPITSYLITPYLANGNNGGSSQSCPAPCTSYTFGGLTNGQTYYFTIAAVTANGPGTTATSPSATPSTTPSIPQNLTITASSQTIDLTWNDPASNGGAPITQETATLYDTNGTVVGSPQTWYNLPCGSQPCSAEFRNLTNGQSYYATIVVSNVSGQSPVATSATATPASGAGAPQNVTASTSSGTITVSWSAPTSDGGATITSYTAWLYANNNPNQLMTSQSCNVPCSSMSFTGLVNGNGYRINLAAVNRVGAGAIATVYATPLGLPSAPQNATATPGNGKITVNWAAPADAGGTTIQSYTVTPYYADGTSAGSAQTYTSSGPQTYTGLTNGQGYYYTITAYNGVGNGPVATTPTVMPSSSPSAPQSVGATAGNTTATVTWSAPASDGGSPITSYAVSPHYPGGSSAGSPQSCGGSCTSTTFTGLTNGQGYYFTVTATNANGTGPFASSPTVTPATPPAAPPGVSASAGNAAATVTWNQPSSGGSPITSYVVTPYLAGGGSGGSAQSCGPCSSLTVTGLTNGQGYYFSVAAVNAMGNGLTSTSPTVTPTGPPSAPQNVSAAAGNATATVSWSTPGSNGGLAITSYTVVPYKSDGSSGGTTQSCAAPCSSSTFSGLTNGTGYYFTVAAVNSAGTGPASTSVTMTPSTVPSAPQSVSASAGNGSMTVTWSAPTSTGGSAITSYSIAPYYVNGSSAGNPQSCSSSCTSLTIYGLTNGQGYYATVAAFNSPGSGPTATSGTVTPLGPPSSPQNLGVGGGNSTATVSWSAPASTGGSAITSYSVAPFYGNGSSAGSAQSCGGSCTSATFTGLTNGQSYYFTVTAVNAQGSSAAAPSPTVTPTGAATAPQGVTVTPGNLSVTVTWSTPANTGGSAISSYTIAPYYAAGATAGSPQSCTTPCTSVTFSGLTEQGYYFTVAAVNSSGTGPAASSATVTPNGPPSAPQSITATAGNSTATVTWSAPASNGGAAVTSYQVTQTTSSSSGPTQSCNVPCSSATFTGLTNGTSYSFSIVAINTYGTGSIGSSSSVMPVGPPTVPQAIAASAGNASVTVTWSAPASNGGSPVTSYNVAPFNADGSSAGSAQSCGSPCASTTFNGLTNGQSYYFTVIAVNGVGSSPAGTTATVTPLGPPSAPQNVSATAGNGSAFVSWSPPASTGGTALTTYVITPYQGGTAGSPFSISAPNTSTTATGLTNGLSYTFQVQANNSAGASPAATSNAVIPAAPPSAPQNVTASGANGSVTVTWAPPASNGGAAITSYQATAQPQVGSAQMLSTCSTCTSVTFTGLTHSTTYTFSVTASNAIRTGPSGSAPPFTTGATPPAPPTGVTATPGNGSITAGWTAPSDNGGAAITGYTVSTYTAAGTQVGSPQSTCATCTTANITGLNNGTTYYVTVAAVNNVGTGTAAASPQVTPGAIPNAAVAVDRTSVSRGEAVTYTVTISNPYASTMTVTYADNQLPSGVIGSTTLAMTFNGASCTAQTTPSCNSWPSEVRLNQFTLGPNAAAMLVFRAVAAGGDRSTSVMTESVTAANSFGSSTAAVTTTVSDSGLGDQAWWSYVQRDTGPGAQALVNAGNGNLMLREQDSTPIADHGGLQFSLRRVYNSADSGVLNVPGALAPGWRLTFDGSSTSASGVRPSGLFVPPQESVANVLPVELIDSDGSRWPMTLGYVSPTDLSTVSASSQLAPLLPRVLQLDTVHYTKLCVDQVATSGPAGVHISLWRYIELTPTSTTYPCTPAAGTTASVLGFGAIRPDRLRYEFAWDGHELDMADANGNELVYSYGGGVPATGASVGALSQVRTPRSGRSFALSYTPTETDVTDPAQRVTRYLFSSAGGPLTTVINPDGSQETYTYGSGNCSGAGAIQLCSITDVRGHATRFTYTTTASDGTGFSPARVASVTDRRGSTTSLTYTLQQDYVTVDEAGHRDVYESIDAEGRVGEVDSGDTTGTYLHQTVYTWDAPGYASTNCRLTDQVGDNDLCRVVRHSLTSATPDSDTRFQYNPEGFVVQHREVNSPADTTTTWGYAGQAIEANGLQPLQFSDTIAGLGSVTVAGTRTDRYSLFVIDDLRQMLSPLGNAVNSYSPYLTTYYPDDNATASASAGSVASTCANVSTAPVSNTGDLCGVDGPAFASGSGPTSTRSTYDTYGQRVTMTTAKAIAEDGSTLPHYTYTYYGDGDHDLSGTQTAGGWLKAVTDPSGNFTASAYDVAGNVVRTWDRNATQGTTISQYPGSISAPPSPAYVQTLYASGAGFAAYTNPWRYPRSKADQLGDLSSYTVDADGNVLTERPPRGNLAGTSAYDIVQTFDAADHLLTRLMPAEAAANRPTTYTYDTWGNRASTSAYVLTDASDADPSTLSPSLVTTTSTYDSVNRLTSTNWTRGPWASDSSATYPSCTQSAAGDAPIPSGFILCHTISAYDGEDNVTATTDGNGQTTTVTFDALGQVVERAVPRNDKDITATYTTYVHDPAGNVTDTCSPRQFTEGGSSVTAGSCPTSAHYATHSTYDKLGRMVTQSTYAADTGAVQSSWSYDADGNPVQTVDANGHATTTIYDLLDRKTSQTVPRSSSQSLTTTWTYDPAGNTLSVTAPGTHVTAYGYDADGRLTDTVGGADNVSAAQAGLVDSGGTKNIRSRVAYDADGHVVATFDANAFTASTTTPDARFMVRTDYDVDGRPIARYVPRYDGGSASDLGLSSAQTTQCPSSGLAIQSIAGIPAYPSGVGVCVTQAQYDPSNDLVVLTLPTATGSSSNRYQSYGYTDDRMVQYVNTPSPAAAGQRVMSATDTFDADGHVLKTMDALGRPQTTSYFSDGLVNQETGEPNGSVTHITKYRYDAAGDTVALTDPAGKVSTTDYFEDGRRADAIDPAGDKTSYTYDGVGNVLSVLSPSGNARDATNPSGTATTSTYSWDNLLLSSRRPVSGDGSQLRQTTYAYFDFGAKQSQDTALVTSSGNLLSDAGSQTYSYAADGRLLTENGRSGETISRSYTPSGQLASVTDTTNGGSTVSGTYYLDDLPRTTSDGVASTAYTYQGDGQISGRRQLGQLWSNTTTYTRSDAGPVSSMSTSAPSNTWSWNYDAAGQPQSASLPNGLTSLWSFAPDATLNSITLQTSGGGIQAQWQYFYDADDRISEQDFHGVTGGGPWMDAYQGYGYDPASRLTSWTLNGTTQNLTWDHDSNRLSMAGSTWTYNADDSLATFIPPGATALPAGYSPAGDMTGDGCTTYTFDGLDRLTDTTTSNVSVPGCPTTSSSSHLRYDGLDRQRLITDNGTTIEPHYDGWTHTAGLEHHDTGNTDVGYQLGGDGTPQGDAVWGSGGLSKHETLTGDGHGSVITDTLDNQSVGCQALYTPFGAPLLGTCDGGGSMSNTFYYRSEHINATTGTYQMGARAYDPSKGAFLQPDAYRAGAPALNGALAADPQTENGYGYARGNPLNLWDPSGHMGILECNGDNRNSCNDATQQSTPQQDQAIHDQILADVAQSNAARRADAPRRRVQTLNSGGPTTISISTAHEVCSGTSSPRRLIGYTDDCRFVDPATASGGDTAWYEYCRTHGGPLCHVGADVQYARIGDADSVDTLLCLTNCDIVASDKDNSGENRRIDSGLHDILAGIGMAGGIGKLADEGAAADDVLGADSAVVDDSIVGSWRGTNMSAPQSFAYHYVEHGAGMTEAEYDAAAQSWASAPAGVSKPIEFRDGTWGTVWRTKGGGPGGMLDADGNIVDFWTK